MSDPRVDVKTMLVAVLLEYDLVIEPNALAPVPPILTVPDAGNNDVSATGEN